MRRAYNRGSSLGRIVDSNKNIVSSFQGIGAATKTDIIIARAVDSATNAVTEDVERGCKLKAIWIEFWVYATQDIAEGVTTGIEMYVIKNPGANLTTPSPGTEGSSNEKKFIFKSWKGLIGQRTDGSPPYFFKGWIKIPRLYQRMGADDLIQLVVLATGSSIVLCRKFIYKWYK